MYTGKIITIFSIAIMGLLLGLSLPVGSRLAIFGLSFVACIIVVALRETIKTTVGIAIGCFCIATAAVVTTISHISVWFILVLLIIAATIVIKRLEHENS